MTIPFRVSPFEFYMLRDDRASHPMTFVICLDFSGRIDTAVLSEAVRTALPRHPLLVSNVVGTSARELTWRASEDPFPVVDAADLSTPCRYEGDGRIDLQRSTGLRIWARHSPDKSRLVFQFHHACCDGLGGYAVIEDVLCCYDKIVNGDRSRAELRPIDPQALASRADFPCGIQGVSKRLSRELLVIPRRLAKFFLASPAPLQFSPPSNSPQSAGPLDFLSHTFTRSQTRALRQRAAERGGSSTELLLRDLFVTIRDWNSRQRRCNRGLLRIVVPVSLRKQIHDRLSAANVVSMISLQRRADQLGDDDRLLDGIIEEFKYIRQWEIDRALLQVAQWAKSLAPIAGMLETQSSKCLASTTLSSVGKVFARASLRRDKGRICVGELRLTGVASVPPIRPQSEVSFGCNWYAGELVVNLNYDPRLVASADAESLMNDYLQRIGGTMRPASNDSPGEKPQPLAKSALLGTRKSDALAVD